MIHIQYFNFSLHINFKKKDDPKKQLDNTAKNDKDENRQKSSSNSSRRNSTLTNTKSKEGQPQHSTRKSSSETMVNSVSSSPVSSASALARKAHLSRSRTVRISDGIFKSATYLWQWKYQKKNYILLFAIKQFNFFYIQA